ncbi:MEDS domain-containing protein [Nonomuraea lactucae]|uniref:MEDS domain-containing protein n=1 Tax=Nonomuraea lactucae TaxID=2249762 RepID=UPI000DE49619|nr:MEDS domain-containing protein [Nonomuraea lactucae]
MVKVAGSLLDPDLGDHVCLPFQGDRERIATTRAFTRNGLRRRAKVLIVTHTHTPERTRGWLAPLVAGFEEAEAAGRIAILASADTHFTAGRFDPVRALRGLCAAGEQALREGHSGVYALVDAGWGVDDAAGQTALEAAANALFGQRWLAAVCQYDRVAFSHEALERVAAVHPIAPERALLRFTTTCAPPGLRLSGDIDLTNRQAFASVLAPLEKETDEVVIDATGVGFMDAGSAQLLTATALARGERRTVVVCDDTIARVLRLIRADELLTVQRAGDV